MGDEVKVTRAELRALNSDGTEDKSKTVHVQFNPETLRVSLGLSQQKIEFIPPPKGQPPGAGAPGTSPLAEAPSGSSLQKLAAGLGKAEEWQRIARNNGIENPRLLSPGQLIDMNIPKLGG